MTIADDVVMVDENTNPNRLSVDIITFFKKSYFVKKINNVFS